MNHFRHADEVRGEVARLLERDPGDPEWEYLRGHGFIDEVLGAHHNPDLQARALKDLLGRLQKLISIAEEPPEVHRNLRRGGTPVGGGAHAASTAVMRRVHKSQALVALAKINMIEAAAMPEVRTFREQALAGQLLSSDPLDPDGWRTWSERHPDSCEGMEQLAGLLSAAFGWEREPAERFILTGVGPELGTYFSAHQVFRLPGSQRSRRVTITATPLVVSRKTLAEACHSFEGPPKRRPAEKGDDNVEPVAEETEASQPGDPPLARIFSWIPRRFLSAKAARTHDDERRFFRDYKVSSKSAELAVHVARTAEAIRTGEDPNGTWLTAMEAWNTHAETNGWKQYPNETGFRAAARAAYKLVTADELDWPKKPGRPRGAPGE